MYEVYWIEDDAFGGPRHHPRFKDCVIGSCKNTKSEVVYLCAKTVKTFIDAIDVINHLMSWDSRLLSYYGKRLVIKKGNLTIDKKKVEKEVERMKYEIRKM